MLWVFTALGAALGWFLAGIPGLLLGGSLGQVFDRRLQWDLKTLVGRLWRQPPLQGDELLFVLLGRLAKSGGRVAEAHIQAARAEMQRRYMDAARQRLAIQAFGRGKSGQDDLRPALFALQGQADEVRALLQSCWRLARAQGEPHELACRLILEWGHWAGWAAEAVHQLDTGRRRSSSTGAFRSDAYHEALRLLGINAGASPEQIKLAYRRLLSQCHPDKLSGSGASAEAMSRATERTRELHAAYKLIRERHGF